MLNNIYNHSCDMRDAFHLAIRNNPLVVVVDWNMVQETVACEAGIELGAAARAAGETEIIKANSENFGATYFFRWTEKYVIDQLNKILFRVS